jgi:SAM-dependent methyltransferase
MPAHPLAIELIERLKDRPRVRVVDLGTGSGRNADALLAADFDVTALDDTASADATSIVALGTGFDAVLATHALLHGTPQSVTERIAAIALILVPGGLFYATFASTRDARYRTGRYVTDETFTPIEGDEAGVPHVYYDERRLRADLAPHFYIDALEELGVDDVAGGWAHRTTPLRGAVHWLVRSRKPITSL